MISHAVAAVLLVLTYWAGRRCANRGAFNRGLVRGFSVGFDIGQLHVRQSVVDCLDEMEGER